MIIGVPNTSLLMKCQSFLTWSSGKYFHKLNVEPEAEKLLALIKWVQFERSVISLKLLIM